MLRQLCLLDGGTQKTLRGCPWQIDSPSVRGKCAKYQRQLAVAIKNARFMGLLPEVK